MTQHKIVRPLIEGCLQAYADDAEFIAELTDNANIHYHGWIVFKDDVRKYKMINWLKRKRSIIGFMKIDKEKIGLDSIDRVKRYMMKDIDKTRAVLSRSPLIKKYDYDGQREEIDKLMNIKIDMSDYDRMGSDDVRLQDACHRLGVKIVKDEAIDDYEGQQ